ncbi:HpsJ family protein [Oscillatoria amoena NRMC-F 0135]|nr:HpsJ family protein [Oscillatoria amoena NRMC-F 0135]
MKATNSGTISNLAARALQLVGIVMIASFLLDALTLLFPPNLTNVQWRLSFTSQLIDRGVIPLVGTALLLAGLWLSSDPADSSSTSSGQSFLRGVSLVLAWI